VYDDRSSTATEEEEDRAGANRVAPQYRDMGVQVEQPYPVEAHDLL